MISIRAINRQTGWLGVEVPWNGAALLASHSLMGRGLISEGSLARLPSPKHPRAPWERGGSGVPGLVPRLLTGLLKGRPVQASARPSVRL